MKTLDTLVCVNGEDFSNLMFWLERCSDRGHLDQCFDLVEPTETFFKLGFVFIDDPVEKGGRSVNPV